MSIGEKLSPILEEIEDALWEYDAKELGRPEYSDGALRSATKIFMSVLMDKMWELQENEDMPIDDRCNMALSAGNELRELVKVYTGIDTTTLYEGDG